MNNTKKICAVLFAAIMLVGLGSPYQALTSSATPTAARAGGTTNTTARVSPVLNFTILVPNNNPVREQYGAMVVNGLDNLGINATLAILPFGGPNSVGGRALFPNSTVLGKTYAEGGYDILCIGWSSMADPDPFSFYHTSQFAPAGNNIYLWNNTLSDQLVTRIRHEMNQAKLLQLLQQEQSLVYDEAPSVALFYPDLVLPTAKNLSSTPIAASYDYSWPSVETWNYTQSPLTNVTLAQPFADPMFSYVNGFAYSIGEFGQQNQAITCPIFGEGSGYGLLRRGAAGTLDVLPYMAFGNYTHSADYRNWNFTVKPNIYFQDGENLTAQDVVYTLRYLMTQSWGAYDGGFVQSILGSNTSVYWAGEQGTPGATEPRNKYEVQFRLPGNYSYFLQEICTLPILPCSVLINSPTGIPDYISWNPDLSYTENFMSSPFNTGSGSSSYHAKNGTSYPITGPIGAGPYRYVGYSSVNGTLHLTKFMGYFNRTQLEAASEFRIKDYYVKSETLPVATSALKAGSIQIIDENSGIKNNMTWVKQFDSSFCNIIVVPGDMVQEVAFNMRNPIFGTGLGTPLGMADPTQAAAAAKDMRRGIEYLFLKDSILKNMTNGYGMFGVTSPVTPAMFGFDNNIPLRNDTTLNQRLLAIKYFEDAGYHFYVDLSLNGVNATTPGWTFKQYGFNVATQGAGGVSVIFYTAAPPGAAGAPSGAVPVVYLSITGFKLQGSSQTFLYVYYNRTRVRGLGVNESQLAIYVWNTTATPQQWSSLVSTHLVINSTTGVVFALAPHFSYFAVFGTSAPSGGGGGGGGGGVSGGTLVVLLVAAVAFGALIAVVVMRKKK